MITFFFDREWWWCFPGSLVMISGWLRQTLNYKLCYYAISPYTQGPLKFTVEAWKWRTCRYMRNFFHRLFTIIIREQTTSLRATIQLYISIITCHIKSQSSRQGKNMIMHQQVWLRVMYTCSVSANCKSQPGCTRLPFFSESRLIRCYFSSRGWSMRPGDYPTHRSTPL